MMLALMDCGLACFSKFRQPQEKSRQPLLARIEQLADQVLFNAAADEPAP
jgi:hypothetical protein